MVQLPALSISSNHWFAVGRWKITQIQKFAVASERNIQQIWSTRISLTKQLILPVIDVINNSWDLYYPDLYSCINQGYIACFLCYFSSWMLKRGASMVNEIHVFFFSLNISFTEVEYIFPVIRGCISFVFWHPVVKAAQSPSEAGFLNIADPCSVTLI